MQRVFATLFCGLTLVACDKTESAAPVPAASSVASPAHAEPPPASSKAAEPVMSAATPPAPSGSAAAVDCGGKENPCPLQAWMRENVNPPMNKHDMPALAIALDKIAGFAPPGYPNWASISKDGANAARSGDENAAKASCRGCHDQYKQKYKTDLRGRKVPGT
jgi:hypothetical protein